MAQNLAIARLASERKSWRKDHPIGFFARPDKNPDGSLNMFKWQCGFPGKEGTIWEGGVYPVTLTFSDDYPTKPPLCAFPGGFFHPNVFPNGAVCLSILDENLDWKPSITLKQILMGVQELLDNPNPKSPAQSQAIQLYMNQRAEYEKRVRAQAQKYPATS
eukprot:TRINITY_DN12631_c0_g1_i1.p1 TRINITY_DN12631_c0_g1~~TRINITY_DN12631_c0_g1_i1.p1  ORF type:complete len:161 (-),score=23.22 TRINITY_DN12631_c0_g1_i1:92-574(-)